MALVLQLVPVLSMGFLLTTAVGSALWVGELEDGRKRRRAEEAGGRMEGGKGMLMLRLEGFHPLFLRTSLSINSKKSESLEQ